MSAKLLTVVKNVRLPSGGEPVDIVLAGGRIIAVGRGAGKDFPRASLLDAGGSLKVTFAEVFPAKGRATGGVRAHRFLKGEDVLTRGWITTWPAVAASSSGEPVALPEPDRRRAGPPTSPAPRPSRETPRAGVDR